MALSMLWVFGLLALGACTDPVHNEWPHKVADQTFLRRQQHMLDLFWHIHEPMFLPEQKKLIESWDLENHLDHFNNVTAVKKYIELFKYALLPRGVPFSVHDDHHMYEAEAMFNMLFSAKDFDTLYKTASYLRDHVNEALFVYVVNTVIVHHRDTQGLKLFPIYEIFPSFFFNGQIMNIAQGINTHGSHNIEHYPETFVRDDDIVIKLNETVWTHACKENLVKYFTHDPTLNAWNYYRNLLYPQWLGGDIISLKKDNRGESHWFNLKQIMTRYYMERLSNDLGEIPVLGVDTVERGYASGLTYYNGVPFPSRPDHFQIKQSKYARIITHINDYERRIRDAIDRGHFVDEHGEEVDIRKPEALEILGNLVEANVDSANRHMYRDFIGLWKMVLGNSMMRDHDHHKNYIPLLLPSTLEHYQTALRDPAFYMIGKRILHLYQMWFDNFPPYTYDELAVPSVKIEHVEVDKLLTYFEHNYINVTNHLHMSPYERAAGVDDTSVLVQYPQMNHKPFQVRVHVKSDDARKVIVNLFIAPKYDSLGYEIPLHHNTENFFKLDEFIYDLPAGEHVIKYDSTDNMHTVKRWMSADEIYNKAEDALHGKGEFIVDLSDNIGLFPHHLLLPKGRVGGMPVLFLVYISEHRAPKTPYGTGYDHVTSLGLGSGARSTHGQRHGFPLDRKLYDWQTRGVHNLHIEDVMIYHKPTPEINVPHNY